MSCKIGYEKQHLILKNENKCNIYQQTNPLSGTTT